MSRCARAAFREFRRRPDARYDILLERRFLEKRAQPCGTTFGRALRVRGA